MSKRSSRSRISGINRVTPGRKVQLVLVFLLAQSLFLYSDCFRVRHVTVHGTERMSRQTVVEASELHPAANPHVTEFSLKAVQARLGDLLWVRSASARYRFPSEVEIDVVERHPVLLVARDDDRPKLADGAWRNLDWYSVDPEGLVLERVEGPQRAASSRGTGSELPRLLVDRPVQVRKKVSVAAIDKVLQWAPVLKEACGNSIAYFRVDGMGQVSFVTPLVHRPTLVRIGAPEKEFEVQVLRMLCERIEREGRPVDYVDLRFAYPAIRYPKPVAMDAKPGATPATTPDHHR